MPVVAWGLYCLGPEAALGGSSNLGLHAGTFPSTANIACTRHGRCHIEIEADIGKAGRMKVAAAVGTERNGYANVQSQPNPTAVVAEIKSFLATLERPGLPPRSIQFAQQQMALEESMLCWMDFFAKRPYSFPDEMRAAYLAELRAKYIQKQVEEAAHEAAKPDGPKTVGGGSRGR